MWTLGTMSQTKVEADAAWYAHLHMSIGVSAYALLWARILWRVAAGHPDPHPGQSAVLFPVAKYFHYFFLVAIGIMLLSGPLMVWSSGDAVEVFAFTIPSPFTAWRGLHDLLRRVHGVTATVIILGAILHILAALKHIVINRDGTFDKIMIADGAERSESVIAMEFLTWLEQTEFSTWMRESDWGHPIGLCFHAVGMGLVVGISFMFCARVLGYAKSFPLGAFDQLFGLGWFGFAMNAASGIVLLIADPRRMPFTPAFLIKMVLIVFAGLSLWALSRALEGTA